MSGRLRPRSFGCGQGGVVSEAPEIEQIADELLDAVIQPGSTLFAGAGVGSRAGLPDWRSFVLGVADECDTYDTDTATMMRKAAHSGNFLYALELFRISPVIPEGTRFNLLATPFGAGRYNAKPLRALVALPFDAIVTTNFDRSLHDAFATVRSRTAFAAELGDPSLKQAIYNWKDPYIARIHGRAEVPRTLVLDQTGYERTERDFDYLEFLIHILTRTRCIFVGYSFVDPAIHRVLQVCDERVASGFPIEHLAVVPSNSKELRERLARYNIRVLLYDESADHEALWRAVRRALDRYKANEPKPPRPQPVPLASAHRFLAASYARSAMAPQAAPLKSVIAEGIVLGLLVETDGLTRIELAERLRRIIPMTSSEAERATHPAVDRLAQAEVIQERERQLWLLRPPENRITADIDALVVGVVNRLKVRCSVDADENHRTVVRQVLHSLVMSRGWDLAASLASAKRSDLFDLSGSMDTALGQFGSNLTPTQRDAMAESVRDLIERPTSKEASILTRLARLSFGVEIALERGRSTFVHAQTLPERIYLDASVLLPAITPGHPYRATYVAAIRRLQDAAGRAGVASRVLVLDSFLNEIVSHRANAIRLVEEGGLEDPDRLSRFIGFTRADYTNVYVGGYSSYVGRAAQPVSFQDYLNEVAPYQTEADVAAFLLREGIDPISSKPADPKEKDYLQSFGTELYAAYTNDVSQREPKAEILIRHEAQQLARLMREIETGARSVFVTADSRLRRLSTGEVLGRVAPALFSHTGLLHLVDLLVGLDADDESFSRLLWAVDARDERDALRGYFIDLGLRRYDAALAMTTPKLLDGIVGQTLDAAAREGVQLAFLSTGAEVGKTFDFLDRFEERFYERMAEEMRDRAT